jgi:hypothetical protein
MVLDATPFLCPFITALDIFTLRKDIAKQHYNNILLNVLDNASLAVYQLAFIGHWLVMGLKTNNSLVDTWLSKMEWPSRTVCLSQPLATLRSTS